VRTFQTLATLKGSPYINAQRDPETPIVGHREKAVKPLERLRLLAEFALTFAPRTLIMLLIRYKGRRNGIARPPEI
jgi:hypothetical protein